MGPGHIGTYKITKQNSSIDKSKPCSREASQETVLLKLWPILCLWNCIGIFIRGKPMAMRIAPSFTELWKYWGLKRALNRFPYGMDIIITQGGVIFCAVRRRPIRCGAQKWRLLRRLTSISQLGQNHASINPVRDCQIRCLESGRSSEG